MPAWRRTFWAVFAADLITAVGMMSFLPFFPVHLAELGVEDPAAMARWTGLASGAAPFTAALMAPLWGALGDRFGRRLMVVRALIAIALFVGAMAFVRSPLELVLLRVGQGVFSGFVAPSLTLVSLAAPPHAQGRVGGGLQAALAAGSILGPLVGAVGSGAFGIRGVYVGVALAALVAAGVVLLLAREDLGKRRAAEAGVPLWRVALGGWLELPSLWRRPRLRRALAQIFSVHFGVGAFAPLLSLYVALLLVREPRDVEGPTGALFSAVAAVLLVAAPLWGRLSDRIGHLRALAASAVGTGLALTAHAIVPSYAALFGVHLVMGVALAGAGPSSYGIVSAETAEEERGSAFGFLFAARAMARSVSAMIGGALAAVLGLRGLAAAAGLLILATSVLAALPRRRGPGTGTGLSTIDGGAGTSDHRM